MSLFPIAETFVSPQGEGLFTGTMMLFIRLAGCTVGKQFTPDEKKTFNVVNDYQTKCTAWNGKEFACDTNYKMANQLTERDIARMAEELGIRRVCLTGGEPLMHKDIGVLIRHLNASGIKVHVETSGTVSLKDIYNPDRVWITVSPKKNFIADEVRRMANEVKILIDETTEDRELAMLIGNTLAGGPTIWIQPINYEHSVNQDNVKRCIEFMHRYPTLRLSIQMHKIIGVR